MNCYLHRLITTSSVLLLMASAFSLPVSKPAKAEEVMKLSAVGDKYFTPLLSPERTTRIAGHQHPKHIYKDSILYYAFMAGPGKVSLEDIQFPTKNSRAHVEFHTPSKSCATTYTARATNQPNVCIFDSVQPMFMYINLHHNSPTDSAFSFRLTGYSGPIQDKDVPWAIKVSKETDKSRNTPMPHVDPGWLRRIWDNYSPRM